MSNMQSNPEDPLVMYLIVRESLKMGIGKTAAQCAHATQKLIFDFEDQSQLSAKLAGELGNANNVTADVIKIHEDLLIKTNKIVSNFVNWVAYYGSRKVVLKADEKEWVKLKSEFKDSMVLIIDAGYTEIPPNTETVIGLRPMYKSQVPKVIQRLQALK